jgi:hypothetical protein
MDGLHAITGTKNLLRQLLHRKAPEIPNISALMGGTNTGCTDTAQVSIASN